MQTLDKDIESKGAQPISATAPKTLLSIDDDDCIVQVIQITLETTAGWQVLGARSGREGLAIAVKNQPDVILLDHQMPVMTGVETLQELKTNAITQHIPVIFLTARPALAKRHQDAGADIRAIIAKPFDVLTLAHQISKALAWND